MSHERFSNRLYHLGAVFTVLVILVHSENLYLITDQAYMLSPLYGAVAAIEGFFSDRLGAVAVPGFFFISGYLFARSLDGGSIGISEIISKWKDRFWSLLIPYLIWNLIYYAIYLVAGRAELSPGELFRALVLYGYNPVFWYMQQLILLSVAAPFLYAVLRDGGRKAALFVLLLIFIVAANNQALEHHLINEDAIFYYCCGMTAVTWYRDIFETEGERVHRLLMCVCLAIFTCSFAITETGSVSITALYIGATILQRISGAVGIWMLLSAFELGGRASYGWMHISFFVYATHYLIIRAVWLIMPVNTLMLLIGYLLMPVICIFAAYMASKIMKRYVRPVYGLLCGGR